MNADTSVLFDVPPSPGYHSGPPWWVEVVRTSDQGGGAPSTSPPHSHCFPRTKCGSLGSSKISGTERHTVCVITVQSASPLKSRRQSAQHGRYRPTPAPLCALLPPSPNVQTFFPKIYSGIAEDTAAGPEAPILVLQYKHEQRAQTSCGGGNKPRQESVGASVV